MLVSLLCRLFIFDIQPCEIEGSMSKMKKCALFHFCLFQGLTAEYDRVMNAKVPYTPSPRTNKKKRNKPEQVNEEKSSKAVDDNDTEMKEVDETIESNAADSGHESQDALMEDQAEKEEPKSREKKPKPPKRRRTNVRVDDLKLNILSGEEQRKQIEEEVKEAVKRVRLKNRTGLFAVT